MPIRLLRPGLKDSEWWNACDFPTQSLYIRLLNLVDDYGRYEADVRILKGHAFALYPDIELDAIAGMCKQLRDKTLAIFYRNKDGKVYLALTRWKEKPRSASKYPDPAICEQLQTIDRKCLQMITSPPSPSPSPSPSTPPCAGNCVELPAGFPKTETEAISACMAIGVPDDFVLKTWNKAVSRGGRDSKEVLIASWAHHVATEWAYHKDRQAKEKNNGTRPHNSGTDRNSGTYNEGRASEYAKAVRRG